MPKKTLFVVALASLMTLGAASPALADCCDSVWDCAATVATEGISCAVQEFIDTVKGLVTFVSNLMSEATGATGDAKRDAQQSVSNTIDVMTTQSRESDAQLAQADEKGKKLASAEKQYKILEQKSLANVATANVSPGAAPATPAPTTRPPAAARQAPAQPAAPASNTRGIVHTNITLTHPTAPSSTPLTATLAGQSSATMKPLAAPARSYMAEMDRASAVLSKARAAGDKDLNDVNQQMANARRTEGTGIQSAQAIADQALSAPFRNLLSQLTSMLANPTDLTSPTSSIEAAANSIMSNLDVSVSQVIEAITAGPNQAFQAAQPSYTDLQGRAEYAQRLAGAMDVLYKDRTPAALAALTAILPRDESPAAAAALMKSTVAGGVPFSQVMTGFAASRQKTKAAYLQRFQGFSQRMAQYEAVRVKARTNRGSIERYRSNFSTKLNSYLTGKTPAELTAQRDSLIAEARKHFANDPKTRDAVINLLGSETAKRSTMIRH